jgi:hypothetical protein
MAQIRWAREPWPQGGCVQNFPRIKNLGRLKCSKKSSYLPNHVVVGADGTRSRSGWRTGTASSSSGGSGSSSGSSSCNKGGGRSSSSTASSRYRATRGSAALRHCLLHTGAGSSNSESSSSSSSSSDSSSSTTLPTQEPAGSVLNETACSTAARQSSVRTGRRRCT